MLDVVERSVETAGLAVVIEIDVHRRWVGRRAGHGPDVAAQRVNEPGAGAQPDRSDWHIQPVGAPASAGSDEIDRCVLAMHTGSRSNPLRS